MNYLKYILNLIKKFWNISKNSKRLLSFKIEEKLFKLFEICFEFNEKIWNILKNQRNVFKIQKLKKR